MSNEWPLARGELAHQLEVSNALRSLDEVERAFRSLQASGGLSPTGTTPNAPTFVEVESLHRVLVAGLLPYPGSVRANHVQVRESETDHLIHDPPQPNELPRHIEAFEEELRLLWRELPPDKLLIKAPAYCLWKLNWIHPFENGNGRTARIFSFLVACCAVGKVFKGAGFPETITMQRRRYYRALSVASNTFSNTGLADLGPTEDLIRDAINRQLFEFAF